MTTIIQIPIDELNINHHYFCNDNEAKYHLSLDGIMLKLRRSSKGSREKKPVTIFRLRIPDHIHVITHCCSRLVVQKPRIGIQLDLNQPWDPAPNLHFPIGTSYILLQSDLHPEDKRWDTDLVQLLNRITQLMDLKDITPVSQEVVDEQWNHSVYHSLIKPSVITVNYKDLGASQ
ncbi:hypothetical protein M422DRAFT_269251 [Sphaerobolus stellatus SS14]|uniref:Uncharacterized protein n=1 Tax=Sphaerobolus stellatus (strain SS14) TaxID=990650 RepID=A0A0C9U5B4_SPHS4|nr:hypothetical protein M422DRAFT_269251 [Sphaerobolus stellatus SS14]